MKSKRLKLIGSFAIITILLCAVIGIYIIGSKTNVKDELRTAEVGKIEINAANILGQVNPYVFGNNIRAADSKNIHGLESVPYGRTGSGVWNPETKAPVPEVLQLIKDVGITIMRYPGGCLVHNFDWKKAVGPVEDRPDFAFGIDEFIEYCKSINAEPLMNVSMFVGDEKDKANLVEYLNAPARQEYPWAMKRKAWGHETPFNVKYFEMGNESDHGNHNVKPYQRYTAEQYGDWFIECARLMKTVDPSIKMGALMGTGTGPYDLWNKIVLSKVKKEADFICIHTYAVGASHANKVSDIQTRACMANGDDFEDDLSEYRHIIRENSGRDIPLAISEYNAAFNSEIPAPYAAALFSADYVRVLLNPQNNVMMANHWRFGGNWGFILGPEVISKNEEKTSEWKKMAGYYLYRLWAQHFGSDLVETKVSAPKLEFEGYLRTKPHRKKNYLTNPIDNPQITFVEGKIEGARTVLGEKITKLELTNYTGINRSSVMHFSNSFEFGSLKVSPGALYRCTFKARLMGDYGSYRFGIKVGDNRGWSATHHSVPIASIESAKEWTEFIGDITTLPDCSGLTMNWWLGGQSPVPVNATIEVKDIEFKRLPALPPYSMLTASASLSNDRKSLYLIVFNKHSEKDIETDVKINHTSIASTRVWQVNGPNLSAHNGEVELVKEVISGEAIPCFDDGFTYTFPAHSMTAFELTLE